MVSFNLNGRPVSVDAKPDTPLLWVIRDQIGLTGTKYGCGAGLCGACTIHINGEALRSCQTLVSDIAGKSVTTIEGLSPNSSHPLQKAWVQLEVPQCGYCQSGQIMAAVALIRETGRPSPAQVDAAMTNLCRCGTYPRIRKAIRAATGQAAQAVEGAV